MFIPNPSDRAGLTVTWSMLPLIGNDPERVLHLTDYTGASPVMLLNDSLRGLGVPEVEHFSQTHVGVHGSEWRGFNVKPREVTLPVLVSGVDPDPDGGFRDGFLKAYDELWSAFPPGEVGELSVKTPAGVERVLRCRFDSVDDTFTIDPVNRGYARYVLHLTAYDPFWYGDEQKFRFSNAKLQDWLGGGPVNKKGTAFPVVLTPGVGSGWDNLSNKGDVPAWPVIRVEGPLSSWSVQIDGLRVSSDYPVEEFEWITIDTDPRKQSALLDGFEDVMDRLKEWEFAPIPPGGSKSVNIEMVGLGAIVVSVQYRFLRAW